WQDATLMAAGLAILANSRPYEGLLLALPLVGIAAWNLRTGPGRLAVALPMLVILGATALAMSAYFIRFSGHRLELPYAFYRRTVTMAPHFVFQAPRPE